MSINIVLRKEKKRGEKKGNTKFPLNLNKKQMTEDQLQQRCVIHFKNEYQRLKKGLIFSVPNGGSRNVLEAKKLKETGLLRGVSDLIVLLPNKILFIELKLENGIQSDVQKEFQNNVENLGFEYKLIRSFEQFKQIL